MRGLARLHAVLEATLSRERGRWVLWLPVLLAAGIALYFAPPVEPGWTVVAACVLLGLMARLTFRSTSLRLILSSVLLMLALGFSLAKVRTALVASPMIRAATGVVDLSGWVLEWERLSAGRVRVVLAPTAIAANDGAAYIQPLPAKVRVTVSATPAVAVGDHIGVRAVLTPNPEPVMPGGYDFARAAFFRGIGGSGYAVSRAEMRAATGAAPWSLRVRRPIEQARRRIAERIRAVLPGQTGSLAAALAVGERADIDAETTQALRAAGVYHIVSISGLHMMLVAASLLVAVRATLAMWPRLALGWPLKQVATVAAWAGVTVYLLLCGGALTAQRAYIMVSVACLAVLLGRPALSLRNLAFAAVLLLCAMPEAALDAGFQMSFMATAALLAAHEAKLFRLPSGVRARAGRVTAWLLAAVWVAAMTTLVAGLATAPFAAFHFNQSANYALIGNLLSGPLVGVLVMPFMLLAGIAVPFGAEAMPLGVMGAGLDALLVVARFIAGLPHAMSVVPQMSTIGFIAIVAGLIWLTLWRSAWRYGGLGAIAAGLLLGPAANRPDIYVERDGKTVAVRQPDGLLSAPPGRRGGYSLTQWLAADGDPRRAADAARGIGWTCDDDACLTTVAGHRLTVMLHPAAMRDDCRQAQLVILRFHEHATCRNARLLITPRTLAQGGAHHISFADGVPSVATVAGRRGQRPWSASEVPLHAAGFDLRSVAPAQPDDPEP